MVNEAVIKSMGAFGGGIAGSGNVCGILSGGVALISSIYSRGNLEEIEDPRMWRLSYKLFKSLKISPNLSGASIAGTLPG